MSSMNFKNMIQVSMGRRSRSPLSPLSFRMMSRADLIKLLSRCGVDGAAALSRLGRPRRAGSPCCAWGLGIMVNDKLALLLGQGCRHVYPLEWQQSLIAGIELLVVA